MLPDAWSILEAGPGSVLVLNIKDYRVLYGNDQFQAVFGYNAQDFQSEDFTFRSFMDEAQLERFNAQVALVRANREASKKYIVLRMLNCRGEEHSYFLYLSPLKDDVNLFHILVIPDMSVLSFPFSSFESRDLFLQQLEVSKFGSFEWMMSSERVFWTDSLYDIYEIEKGTHIDRQVISSFTHPDDAKKAATSIQRAMQDTGKVDIEMKIITGKKNVKVLRVLATLVKSDDGMPIKLSGSVKDITEQRKIEQDLKRKVEELNKSNRELEEFAYVASHDLQEPLRKISTFSDRLSEKYADVLSGEGSMYLERMMVSAENMRSLINNLLEFSRVTRDKQPFASIDLNFALNQVKGELELVIEESGTVIESNKLPTIDGSLSQINQLFSNILSNAIKFKKEGISPHITVTAEELSDEEKEQQHLLRHVMYNKIVFQDNGIGFEEEYKSKIFQIFQRLHGKSEYPGSGIGLAICKRIAEHHHGLIYADSEEGKGARFTIILPVPPHK